MKYDKKKAVDIITVAARDYHKYLQDKHFLLIYQDVKNIEVTQVEFRSNHFLHLTGIKTELSAQRFYEKCLNRKLSVLPFLHELLYNNCMIGNFINSGICIKADYFVGNTKAVLSVGFRWGKRTDFPVTLYKEDVRKLSSPTNKVLAIFVKDYDQQAYTKYTYLSKGQEIQKLLVSDEVKKLIQIDTNLK